jgi:hypothetical protein
MSSLLPLLCVHLVPQVHLPLTMSRLPKQDRLPDHRLLTLLISKPEGTSVSTFLLLTKDIVMLCVTNVGGWFCLVREDKIIFIGLSNSHF